MSNIVDGGVYQCRSADRIKERFCAAYAVRMVTTPKVVQAARISNGRHSTHASTCDTKPKTAQTSRNPHTNVLYSRCVLPTQRLMTRCTVSRRADSRSYKDENCSASKELFFVQPEPHNRQQLATLSFRLTPLTTRSNEHEVLRFLPRVGEHRGQLSCRL